MNRHILALSLLGLTLSACSSVDNNKQALGDFEYATKDEVAIISIPEGLDTPEHQKDFYISNDINHEGPVGGNVDIRAPSLVLPIAAASRIETDSSLAKVWFDQVLETEDLKDFIHKSLEAELSEDGVGLNAVTENENVYQSDWYHSEKESGVLFTSVDSSESIRFQYEFETKPHGRSVAITVSLIEYMRTDKTGATKTIDLIDKQRAEMTMLNEIIAQVDHQYRLVKREHRLMQATQQLVSIGENQESEPAYIIDMEIDSLWANMPIFFDDYGFKISDINESKYIYFVDFVKPNSSFWDSIWGDDTSIVDVEDASYQFVLTKLKEQTTVTIYDADGNVLTNDVLTKIYPVMSKGLSFRNVF